MQLLTFENDLRAFPHEKATTIRSYDIRGCTGCCCVEWRAAGISFIPGGRMFDFFHSDSAPPEFTLPRRWLHAGHDPGLLIACTFLLFVSCEPKKSLLLYRLFRRTLSRQPTSLNLRRYQRKLQGCMALSALSSCRIFMFRPIVAGVKTVLFY